MRTVYYKYLTEERRVLLRALVNWSETEWARAYSDLAFVRSRKPAEAMEVVKTAIALDLYEVAAQFATWDSMDPEHIWKSMQNLDGAPWAERFPMACQTTFPRSMDLGDLIVNDDGRTWITADRGFIECAAGEIPPPIRRKLVWETTMKRLDFLPGRIDIEDRAAAAEELRRICAEHGTGVDVYEMTDQIDLRTGNRVVATYQVF